MRNAEDLVSKYLDGSLSVSERRALQEMMERSPELAEEVQGLEHLEARLSALRTPLAEHDTAFLNDAEERLLNRMAVTSGSAPARRGGGGHFRKWMAGAGILMVAGVLLWFIAVPGEQEVARNAESPGSAAVSQEADERTSEAIAEGQDVPGGTDQESSEFLPVDTGTSAGEQGAGNTPGALHADEEGVDTSLNESSWEEHSEEQNIDAASAAKESKVEPDAVVTPPAAKSGTAESSVEDQKKIFGQIQVTRRSLRQAESEGNVARQAVLYKQLGLLYGKLEGRERDSRLSLNAARRLAQQEGLTDLEAEVDALLRGM